MALSKLCPYCFRVHPGYHLTCDACWAKRQAQRPPPAQRPGGAKRGYDHKWAKVAKAHKQKNPRCVKCGAPVQMTDHIQELRDGGARLSHRNLQSLCRKCHGKKTYIVRKRRMHAQG